MTPQMGLPQVVIDTNVLVSAVRSRRGASHLLISLIDSGKFETNVSVPLVLEYEASLKKIGAKSSLSTAEIDALVDYICAVANRRSVYFLWRPLLGDPKDDMVLELAVNAGCDAIVTYNRSDFQGAEQFGIRVLTPKEFLQEIGEIP